MPPKKATVDATSPTSPPSAAASGDDEKTPEKKAVHRVASHPSTAIMVSEALKALDSRKGVSSQAIQNYIKQTYTTVDVLRLKGLVRRALIKGLATGTLVRPATSTVTSGAVGRFRLAPKKAKEVKSKTENKDPNVQKSSKETKDTAKKPKKTGGKKEKEDKDKGDKDKGRAEGSKPPKKVPKSEDKPAAATKTAAAKKPKAKKAEDGEQAAPKTAKSKAPKAPKKGKAQNKADSDESAQGRKKRAKKTAA